MRVRVYKKYYDDPNDYLSDWFEVTQEEYDVLAKEFLVEVLKEKEEWLKEARDRQAARIEQEKKYIADAAKDQPRLRKQHSKENRSNFKS